MSVIDFEAQYNNRARVPDHPTHISGWIAEAADYRENTPPTPIPYGSGERAILDLFTPSDPRGAATLVFIHGGYWQAMERSYFSHMARGANAHGISVAVPGYDLCPDTSIAEIILQLRDACRILIRLGRPLVIAGHSAGGHLAACMLATDWRAHDPELPEDSVQAAYAISGLFDLEPLVTTSINGALGLDAESARAVSPLHWKPPRAGTILDAVVGADESEEYHRQSETIVESWGRAGVDTRFESLEKRHHFDVIAPLADADSAMTRRLVALAGG
ncbi:MAG: alpha/beta hydrolase [Salinarimonas sp.]|nr:alpha/beta hydrolase [Salinarimonas sp.]